MMSRGWMLATLTALLATAGWSAAASVRTANFVVEAPTQELAEEFGKLAEHFRQQKALEWLGAEMPRWPTPCPLRVNVTMSGAKGATTFDFGGQIRQNMFIEGPLDRLRNSVLPHEITHTVLAHHFRRPVPRWADEGGSVYSEDDWERSRHDRMCREILNMGRGMPLRRLFSLTDYPSDVMVLYAEGYSITRFLVESSDRQTFLAFVGHGLTYGWDDAAKNYYHYRNVADMERAWLDHLHKGGGAAVVKNTNPDTKLVVRQSIPPAQPALDPSPVSRGQAPAAGQERAFFAQTNTATPAPSTRLGEPLPLNGVGQAQPTIAEANRARNAPPPVILFPPEPLPLR